ncbi:Amino Acid/Auxin Permease (AAAP) Family [Achlya hypogyna]|uniref:Amino Acid/Auxin Permease (AAAP) Family n=1 Tax=Achlya hypogyna TaxID=1202772 RepID=A0A1V9YL61_ACHHY|nr:Amino Acid/Auxin Permease (AAAP) Family [Achlya hypogyna]
MEYTPLLFKDTSSFLTRPHGTLVSSYVALMCSMLGAGILALPSTVVAATVGPSLALLAANALFTGLSFACLAIVADATDAYSYEAIGRLLFSRIELYVLRLVTLVPLFGGAVMYIVIATDMVAPVLPLSRVAIGVYFVVCIFPLCLPDTLHALRFSSTMVVVCVIYVVLILVYHAVGMPWPSATQSLTLSGLASAIPIQTLSFCCHFNFVRSYGELQYKQSIAPVALYVLASGLALYVMASVAGYVCLGGHPPADILTGFPISDWGISSVKAALALCMWCKTPLVFQPFREVLELTYMRPKIEHLRLPYRVLLILGFLLSACVVAVTATDLRQVMAWVGATAGIVVSYIVPGIFLKKAVDQGYLPAVAWYPYLARFMIGVGTGLLAISLWSFD